MHVWTPLEKCHETYFKLHVRENIRVQTQIVGDSVVVPTENSNYSHRDSNMTELWESVSGLLCLQQSRDVKLLRAKTSITRRWLNPPTLEDWFSILWEFKRRNSIKSGINGLNSGFPLGFSEWVGQGFSASGNVHRCVKCIHVGRWQNMDVFVCKRVSTQRSIQGNVFRKVGRWIGVQTLWRLQTSISKPASTSTKSGKGLCENVCNLILPFIQIKKRGSCAFFTLIQPTF